jgi:hypothetical protein
MAWRNLSWEYRHMSPKDQKTFQRLLITNTVVGVTCILGLILFTSVFSGDPSGQSLAHGGSVVQAEAK